MFEVNIDLMGFLAIWGATVSTLLGIFKILEFRRDRANIKVKVKAGYRLIPPGPPYGDESLVMVEVINKGRRPVTIKKIFFLAPKKLVPHKYLILTDSVKSIEIKEGQSYSYYGIERILNEKGITYYIACAEDATGRWYCSHNVITRLSKYKRIK